MPIPDVSAPPGRRLLADGLYDSLLDAIVDGTLLPGEVVSDASVAQWAGVSRTPAREAIVRLGLAGFVVIEPRRATRVAPLDITHHLDVMDALAAIAIGSTRFAVEVATESERATLLQPIARSHVDLLGRDGVLERMVVVQGDTYVLDTWLELLQHARRMWALRPATVPSEPAKAMVQDLRASVAAGAGGRSAAIVEAWFEMHAGDR